MIFNFFLRIYCSSTLRTLTRLKYSFALMSKVNWHSHLLIFLWTSLAFNQNFFSQFIFFFIKISSLNKISTTRTWEITSLLFLPLIRAGCAHDCHFTFWADNWLISLKWANNTTEAFKLVCVFFYRLWILQSFFSFSSCKGGKSLLS